MANNDCVEIQDNGVTQEDISTNNAFNLTIQALAGTTPILKNLICPRREGTSKETTPYFI